MSSRMLIPALKLLLAALVAIFVFLPFLYAFANVYRPRSPVRGSPQADGLRFDTVSFPTPDGETIRGWFLYGARGNPLIVVCHGVGTNREDLRDVSRFLCRAGFNVLTFDFRAHGESTGRKTTFGFREAIDIQTAVRFARDSYSAYFQGIGVYAISMGSAAALFASPHLPEVQAFVLDSPFARLSNLIASQFIGLPPWLRPMVATLTGLYGSLLMGLRVDAVAPENHVQHLGLRPVLVLHGDGDALIPISQGRRLFERISGPKEFVETTGAGHVQSYAVMGRAYEEKVVEFFRTCLN